MGILPENKRREVNSINKKTMWLYGAPFSGKTYLANQFPDPVMLNTDGNIKFIDAPYIAIKDVITTEGRMTKRQFAWDIFKSAIEELELKQNDFKTIVVDLVEDTYEHCRLYMYDKLSIEHESDDSFRAWDKVRTEFLSTIKRLMNLDYENIILISHEDSSKDLTKKSGDKITSIKPNLQDKATLKIAGMVDVVCRVVAEDNKRTLSFKTSEVVFGGGRLNVTSNEIPCEYEELMKVYDEANGSNKEVIKMSEDSKKAQEIKDKFIHKEIANNVGIVIETAINEPANVETLETSEIPIETTTPKKIVENVQNSVDNTVTPTRRRRVRKEEIVNESI